MKQILIAMGAGALLLSACTDRNNTTGYPARDNARTYLWQELGPDSANYEEVRWGNVEPRRVDFMESNAYRLYSDTLRMMEERLTQMNDSIDNEFRTRGNSAMWQNMSTRRDGYTQQISDYRNRQAQLEQQYQNNPEYNGYWIYHEYNVNGQPRKARIGFGDTTNWTTTDIIYE
jgi:hypothetical protein